MIGNAHASNAFANIFGRLASLRSSLEARLPSFVEMPVRIPLAWRQLVNFLYEPLSCTAMLVWLGAAVIWLNASPSPQDGSMSLAQNETTRGSLSQGLSVALASLSTDNAFAAVPAAVPTARSPFVSPDLNYPYGVIDKSVRDLDSAREYSYLHAALSDLVAPSLSPILLVSATEGEGLVGLPEPNGTSSNNAFLIAQSSRMAAPPSQTTPDPAGTSVRGVSDGEIRFGIAAPFSGSARELGRQMKIGIETAFNVANDAGGVNGRQLRLFSADDGYEPSRTADAMKQLLEGAQVFGFVGNVGTPTAAVALPFALEHKMLFFGAFTGANLLRSVPPDHYVFNYRPSYAEETDAVVRYLLKVRGLQPRDIAVFAQQDSYGDAGFDGVTRALRRAGYSAPVLRLNYKRNTVDVDDAVAQLRARKSPVKAAVMVATYRAAANFIEKTRDRYPKMLYTNVSFVGSTALADELMLQGPKFADGIIVTQVVPAVNGYSRAVLDYKTALAKYFPGEAADYVSFEGYIDAKILIEATKRAGVQLDTERLIDALEGIHNLDMGLGTILNFGPSEHQASHMVWGTQLDKSGRFNAIELE